MVSTIRSGQRGPDSGSFELSKGNLRLESAMVIYIYIYIYTHI